MSDALKDLEQKAKDALGVDSRPWHEKALDAAGDAWQGLQSNISGLINGGKDAVTIAPEFLNDSNKNAWLAAPSAERQQRVQQLISSQNQDYQKILDSLGSVNTGMNLAVGGEDKVPQGAGINNVALTIYENTHDLKMPNVIAPALTEVILPNIMPAIGGIWGKAMESMQNGGGFPKGIPAALGTGFQEIVGYFDFDKLKSQIIEQRVSKISNELRQQGFTENFTAVVSKNVYAEAAKTAELPSVNQAFVDNLGKTNVPTVQPVVDVATQIPTDVANQAILASNTSITAAVPATESNAQELPTALTNSKAIQK